MAPRHLAHYFRAPLPNGRRPLIRILPTSASSRHRPWPHPPPGLPPTAVLLYARPTPPAPAAFRRRQSPRPEPAVESGARQPRLLRPARLSVQCRSEEHTSELQSLMRISYAVFCLKKKKKKHKPE